MKNKYIGIVAGLLLLAGCSNDDFTKEVQPQQKLTSFTTAKATIGEIATTRAHLVDAASGGKAVVWDNDDYIYLSSDTQQELVQYSMSGIENNVATFGGDEVSGNKFYAVYTAGWNCSLDEQSSNRLNITMNGVSHKDYGYPHHAPMVAVSADNNFVFKQVTGMIHVEIGNVAKITKVTFRSNNGEYVAGDGYIDLSESSPVFHFYDDANHQKYTGISVSFVKNNQEFETKDIYFYVPPQTFENGFTIDIQGVDSSGNDYKVSKSTTNKLVVERAQVRNFALIDVNAELDAQQEVAEDIRSILMNFYDATGGDNWTDNTNWGSDKPISEWHGVLTAYDGTLYGLNLNNNNLTGYIPRSIGGLKDLHYLYLGDNKLSGSIPDELWTLTELRGLDLSSNTGLSGSLPDNIGDLTHLYYLGLYQCSKIGGPIPESFYTLKELEIVSIAFCSFSGSFSESLGNLESLEDIRMCGNKMSGSIPESIGNLKKLKVFMVRWNNLSGDLPASMGNMTSLEGIYLEGNQLTGGIPDSFMNLSNLTWMNISGNCMSGTITEKMYKSDWWSQVQVSMSQRDGYGLTIEGLYTSADFSKDGKVREIQNHTKGNGIKLVITGDGFTDRLIADGTFDNYADKATEYFFAKEPYATYRDYFDVYAVSAVSKNAVIGADTQFGTKVSGDKYNFNVDAVANFIMNNLGRADLNNITALVILNDAVSGGRVYCNMYDDGFSIGLCTVSEGMQEEINHEIGGHGFGHLADEYWADDQSDTAFPKSSWSDLDNMHNMNWYMNVDYHSNPSEVLWADFISNPDYAVESIGVYEGGYANYTHGIYRPTVNSIMRDNVGAYNAPSRWAIYQRLMELAGENYSFDSFLQYDKKNLQVITRNYVEKLPESKVKHGAPPVFHNYPSSEIGKH
ncbi:MAG: hypothetical protein IJ256_00925 [Bacteroidaceae bacterium]|nr:hypothetical protein [Bacteroidaceae bacterium]